MTPVAKLNPNVRAARDFLVQHREDYETAYTGFTWPEMPRYNFATEWFDGLAEENPDGIALWIIDAPASPDSAAGEAKLSFAELRDRSMAAARMMADAGLGRGDRLLVVLGNCVPLWEIMLGAIRLGAVIIPATPQLSPADLADRVERGAARMLVAHASDAAKFAAVDVPLGRIAVGACWRGRAGPGRWRSYAEVEAFADGDPLPGRWHARATTRCCSTSPPAPPRCRSWSSTRTPPTRSAICRRCTGWV